MGDTTENLYPVDVFAKLFDLTPRRIQQLANDGHFPKGVDGKYALVPTIKGYIRFLKARRGEGDDLPDALERDTSLSGAQVERMREMIDREGNASGSTEADEIATAP